MWMYDNGVAIVLNRAAFKIGHVIGNQSLNKNDALQMEYSNVDRNKNTRRKLFICCCSLVLFSLLLFSFLLHTFHINITKLGSGFG